MLPLLKNGASDGRNYLWVHIDDGGLVRCLTRYGYTAPQKILKAIAEEFDADIFSEYEPQYWGFDTQEEWDAVMDKMAKESEEEFYVSLINYVRGQPNDIQPETIGAIQADIAKKLIEKDATDYDDPLERPGHTPTSLTRARGRAVPKVKKNDLTGSEVCISPAHIQTQILQILRYSDSCHDLYGETLKTGALSRRVMTPFWRTMSALGDGRRSASR